MLLCESSVSCILNSAASDIVRETAEEEMVQYVTTPYILGLFVPFDFEETQKAAKRPHDRQPCKRRDRLSLHLRSRLL